MVQSPKTGWSASPRLPSTTPCCPITSLRYWILLLLGSCEEKRSLTIVHLPLLDLLVGRETVLNNSTSFLHWIFLLEEKRSLTIVHLPLLDLLVVFGVLHTEMALNNRTLFLYWILLLLRSCEENWSLIIVHHSSTGSCIFGGSYTKKWP